jgi:hypothetical protein
MQTSPVNGDPMMKRLSHGICSVFLFVFVLWLLVMPSVTAEIVTETVPTIGLSCARPTHPIAQFSCGMPTNQTPPDGPPYTIECTDDSYSIEPIINWRWDFGTGTTSIGATAQHSYVTHGPHAISLTVSTACGNAYADTATHYVPTYCSVPVPGFTTDVTEGIAPLTVHVTDTSTRTAENLTLWTYWFDDSHSSSEQNPEFTYTGPGNYTINLTVAKTCMDPEVSALPPATRQIIVYPQGSYYATITPNVTASSPPTTIPVTAIPAANQTPAAVTLPETAMVNTTPPVAVETYLGTPEGPGTLSVTTNPAGAEVFVDNLPRGTTPAIITDLSAGSHTLRFEHAGHLNLTTTVIINNGSTTEYAATLMQEPTTGIAIVPVIALAVIVLGIIGGGIYLFLRHRAQE